MSNTRIIDLRSPDFLQICLAPRRRPGHHHHHLSQREERKASFAKGGWIKKDKCKVTLPKLKVGVIQAPVSGIVDKIKGAWSKVKLMASVSSAAKRAAQRKKSSSTANANANANPSGTASGDASLFSFSPSSSSSYYSQQAVADCIEFIKQTSSSSSSSSSLSSSSAAAVVDP